MTAINGNDPTAKKIFWSEKEYEMVAATLIRKYPHRPFATTTNEGELPALTADELRRAIKAALPIERYRHIREPWRVKAPLLQAIFRLREKNEIPAKALKKAKAPSAYVTWTPSEWADFAVKVHLANPQYDFMRSITLPELTLAQVNAAGADMPEGRRRSFASLIGVRAHLRTAYTKLTKAHGADYLKLELTPADVATLESKGLPPPRTRTNTGKQVRWTDGEWDTLAQALIGRDERFLTDTALNCLSTQAIMTAQQSLPEDRQRNYSSVSVFKFVKPALSAAIARVKARTQREEVPALPPSPTPETVVDVAPSAPVGAPVHAPTPTVPVVAAAPVAPEANPWEAACRPLVDVLAKELGAGLAAALAPALTQAIAASLMPVIDAAVEKMAEKLKPPRDFPFLPPQRPAADKVEASPPPGPIAAKVAQAQPKPVIGVVGPLPAQQRVLEAAYPEIDLRFVEKNGNGNAVAALQSCTRVIGMTSFMNHPTDGTLRRHFGDRYCRVTGSVSAIKHQIDVWIKTGIISERRAIPR